MKGLEEFDLQAPSHVFTARALPVARDGQTALLDRVKELVSTDLDAERVFIFSAEISNNNLDSYFTRMAESSLRNYAADANTGVAFLDSHQHHQRIGYSLRGVVEIADNDPRVLADFYTVRGLKLANISTDDFVQGVQFGLIRDVSIGFKEGDGFQYTCSICRNDLFSWDCDHIPGLSYTVQTDPEADPSESAAQELTAFAWVENARLSEVSSVYDGATPNAMILKAAREQRGGRLQKEAQRYLERAYRIDLPQTDKQFAGFSLHKPEREVNDNMADKDKSGAPDNNRLLDAEARIAAREAGMTLDGELSALEVCRQMGAEINRLRPFEGLANEGRVLRAALVEETLAEGVRAFGNDFNKEAKERMLGGLDVDTIRELRASWQATADAKLPSGRRSQDNPDAEGTDGTDDGEGDNPDTDENTEGAGTLDEVSLSEVPDDAIGGA